MYKHTAYCHSPLGFIRIEARQEKITCIEFTEYVPDNFNSGTTLLTECIRQLQEYFQGTRRYFTLPCEAKGTEFQKRVWAEVEKIKYASSATYKDIALAVNSPGSCRAIGNAVGANPLPLIIPCHRVIGSNGKLTGFSSGLWRKKWLLEHEQNHMQQRSD